MSDVLNAPATPAPVAAPVSPAAPVAAETTHTPPKSASEIYRERAAQFFASQPGESQPATAEETAPEQPRDEFGRFAPREAAEPAEATEAPADPAAEGQPEGEAAPVEVEQAPEAPEAIRVAVRGRDGTDVEIEVTDPAVAELIRANHNDGMRRDEFNRQMQTVNQYLAEKREFETLLETNPEHVILNVLPEEKRIAIATTLLAQYWDAIVPHIQQYDQNPVARVQQAAQAQIAIRDQQAEFQRRTQAAKTAAEVETATRALIPESVDEQTAQAFLDDALVDLKRAAERGEVIASTRIPDLLAHRVRLYGFQPQAAASAAPSPAKPAAVARPVTPAPTADPAVAAKAKQDALKVQQARRAAAAAHAPVGAGAAPLKVPAVPKGLTVEQASAYVRKNMPGWSHT